MSELKPCPICGGRFQPFKDNYGKYGAYCLQCGMYFGVALECGVELRDGWKAQVESEKELTDALNRRAQPANEPLTLDELRGMDGDKISIHYIGRCEGFYEDVIAPYYGQTEQYIGRENGSLAAVHLPLSGYGVGWLAYRRKPEGSEGDGTQA